MPPENPPPGPPRPAAPAEWAPTRYPIPPPPRPTTAVAQANSRHPAARVRCDRRVRRYRPGSARDVRVHRRRRAARRAHPSSGPDTKTWPRRVVRGDRPGSGLAARLVRPRRAVRAGRPGSDPGVPVGWRCRVVRGGRQGFGRDVRQEWWRRAVRGSGPGARVGCRWGVWVWRPGGAGWVVGGMVIRPAGRWPVPRGWLGFGRRARRSARSGPRARGGFDRWTADRGICAESCPRRIRPRSIRPGRAAARRAQGAARHRRTRAVPAVRASDRRSGRTRATPRSTSTVNSTVSLTSIPGGGAHCAVPMSVPGRPA